MRPQRYPWSCGPAALRNAALVLGVRLGEARIRKLAGCSREGTDEVGLIAAARELGFKAVELQTADPVAAWSFIRDGRPSVICLDNWGHWATVIGTIGDRVLVYDPSPAARIRDESGVFPMTRAQLVRRWRNLREAEGFYAIVIGR